MIRFLFVASLLLVGCGKPEPAPSPLGSALESVTSSRAKVYDREDFRKLVLGVPLDAVRLVLGAPDQIDIPNSGWHYRGRSRDPKTGEVDYEVRLYHHMDRVQQVLFHATRDTERGQEH